MLNQVNQQDTLLYFKNTYNHDNIQLILEGLSESLT